MSVTVIDGAKSAVPEFVIDGVRLVQSDCLQLLASMPDDSVDLIATDPPYYKVKSDGWDRQWPTKADFMAWLDQVLAEFDRVLKPTGSLYLFCSPWLVAETELLIGCRFKVLNNIVWRKSWGRFQACCKEQLRKYRPQTERIIFAESRKRKPFLYEPVRAYLDNTVKAAGLSRKDVEAATGVRMAGHWFGRSQFSLLSEVHYQVLIDLGCELKPYAELKAEYVAIRDHGKGKGRYFAVTKEVPYTDVWDFAPTPALPGRHPCEKPVDLMRHIIQSSSQPGDVVFDAFTGSGSTAVASHELGREFIGSEMGSAEFQQAVDRLVGIMPKAA